MNFMATRVEAISAEAFAQCERPAGSCILDVRTPEEWENGHLPNAIHIDYFSEDFRDKIDTLDKEKTYYVYCKAGKRSAGAIHYMKEAGFKHCININDGIIGLEQTNLPIVKD